MNAVLITGIFVVSIFNVQLGQPIWSYIPMSTMEECQKISEYFNGERKMDIEWNMYMRSQCMPMVEFQMMMEAQRVAQSQSEEPADETGGSK